MNQLHANDLLMQDKHITHSDHAAELIEEDQDLIKRRTISLDVSVWKRLKKFGTFGMSYNDLITSILDRLEGRENPNGGSF